MGWLVGRRGDRIHRVLNSRTRRRCSIQFIVWFSHPGRGDTVKILSGRSNRHLRSSASHTHQLFSRWPVRKATKPRMSPQEVYPPAGGGIFTEIAGCSVINRRIYPIGHLGPHQREAMTGEERAGPRRSLPVCRVPLFHTRRDRCRLQSFLRAKSRTNFTSFNGKSLDELVRGSL